MIGILIAFAISWLLLFLLEKKSLLALGVFPLFKRLQQFLSGFLLTAILCFAVQGLEAVLKPSVWKLNDQLSFAGFLKMGYWDFKSVLTEELIFRGAILYILIKRIGSRGILISAVAFGIYHWFSYGLFGNIVPMIVVFVGTGLMGYAWALAFVRTKSMLMPLGMHFGWNFTFNTIFSNGPLGNGLILVSSDQVISDWFSLIGLWLVPLLVLIFVMAVVQRENG